MTQWRVLVVEDDPLMRSRFSKSVARCSELELAASFGTMAEALTWLGDSANQLDVLLVDLGLPDGSGLDLIRAAVHLHPRCEPLVISMFADDANVLASIEAGALGYIHKDATPDDIAKTILDMRNGESPISPLIARRVLTKYRRADDASFVGEAVDTQGAPIAPAAGPHESKEITDASRNLLSPRQLEVLQLISRGYSYVEIAQLHGVTIHTVQAHIKNLYARLSVNSKTEAVFEASRLGLLPSNG